MECPNQDLFNSIEKNECFHTKMTVTVTITISRNFPEKKYVFVHIVFCHHKKKIIFIFPGDLRFGRMDDITASKTTLPAKHSCQGKLRIPFLHLSIDGNSKSILTYRWHWHSFLWQSLPGTQLQYLAIGKSLWCIVGIDGCSVLVWGL